MEPPRGLRNGLWSSKSSNGVDCELLSDSSLVASRCDLCSAISSSSAVNGAEAWRVRSDPVPGRDDCLIELERRAPIDCFRRASRGSSVGLRERPTANVSTRRELRYARDIPLRTSPSSSLASLMFAGRSSPAMLAPMPLSTHSSWSYSLEKLDLRLRCMLRLRLLRLLKLLLRLGRRLPMGEYRLALLLLLQAVEKLKASRRALCSGSTGRRYFSGGIFSPGW